MAEGEAPGPEMERLHKQEEDEGGSDGMAEDDRDGTTGSGTERQGGFSRRSRGGTKVTVELPAVLSAADLLHAFEGDSSAKQLYWDRSNYDSPESQLRALRRSSTVYVGNLAFTTRTAHLKKHFGALGLVNKVHIGLDRFRKTPCGFAFVEYKYREHALRAVSCLTGTKLDGKVVRVELDAGFKPGRQYGRGQSGGQVRDDRRVNQDPARSGTGRVPRSGSFAQRWQSPPPSTNNDAQNNSQSSDKRKRDDDGGADYTMEDGPSASKNQRFREEEEDDDM